MAARSTPPRRGVSGDCAQTEGAARSEPIASATRVTSVIGHLPKDDQAVGPTSPPATQGRDPGTGGVLRDPTLRRIRRNLHNVKSPALVTATRAGESTREKLPRADVSASASGVRS